MGKSAALPMATHYIFYCKTCITVNCVQSILESKLSCWCYQQTNNMPSLHVHIIPVFETQRTGLLHLHPFHNVAQVQINTYLHVLLNYLFTAHTTTKNKITILCQIIEDEEQTAETTRNDEVDHNTTEWQKLPSLFKIFLHLIIN